MISEETELTNRVLHIIGMVEHGMGASFSLSIVVVESAIESLVRPIMLAES